MDVELYRRTIYVPTGRKGQAPRRISVIDIAPEGATRTLVFVHGYGGNVLQWVRQLSYFGQQTRVIAADMRGHGLSDDPAGLPYTMDGLVGDLELVLDAMQVRRPFYLVAHSFGGAVSTEYALRHPEELSGLVLIGVPTRFILRPFVRDLMNIPDPVFSWIAKRLKIALFASQRTLSHMHDAVMSRWRGDERLPQISVPTLVVLGHRDTVFLREHYEDVPRAIPQSHQVVISVSAHLVQLERPDAVNRAIRRFIDPRVEAPLASSVASKSKPQSGDDEGHDSSAGTNGGSSNNKGAGNEHINRLFEMPWLHYYDSDVPDTIILPRQLLPDMVSNAACDYPNRPAIIFFGQKIGYRELDLLSNRFAHALRKLGVKQGERVAIVLPNIPQCVIAFYGTLKAGAVVVLGSPLSSEDEIAHQLRDSGATVLLTLVRYQDMIERICTHTSIREIIYTDVREYLPIRQRVLLASFIEGLAPHRVGTREARREKVTPALPIAQSSFQQLLRSQPATPFESGTTASDLALLQYTSGTTDTPRGVMLSHANLVVNVAQMRHWMPDARRGREVFLAVLPLSHSYGVTGCMNLCIGLAGSMILLPTTRTEEILNAIKRYRPSIFPGVPALYLAIANYPRVRRFGVSAIRTCVSGSAPLPVEVQEAFEKLTRGRLVEGYGLTEASPATHSNPLEGERRVGSIGLPLPGTNARVVDGESEKPLPVGEVGELLIKGPQVMQGYWQMPGETAQVVRDGWLHTGDLASMDEDGFFSIVDRKKDLILSGSYNVYPRDVEEVLYEHPKVLEAAVVSTRGDSNGSDTSSPFIKAVVVLKRGEQATADELLALCRERLDAYKVPRQVEFRTELPKNFVGKVLRRLLIEV